MRFSVKGVVLYAQMLCFATRVGAVRSPKRIENSEKVLDCWSKSSFEVQNCVTVNNSADFSEKPCAQRQLYVCEFGAPKKVSKTIGLLCHFTFYVHAGLVFDNFQGAKTNKNH